MESPTYSQRCELRPSFWGQLHGFLIKIFKQRVRAPASTLFTIFIPCLFILGMSVSYWLTPTVLSPPVMYGASEPPSIASCPMNLSTSYDYLFCTSSTSTLALPFSSCMFPESQLTCLPNVGSGKDLCIPTVMYAGATGALYSMYYGSGAFAVNSMDGYLALSALATYITNASKPTFFGRSGQASLSHYGSLLVASDSTALGSQFMSYCKTQSVMCNEILYNETIFSTLEEAKEYALSHSGTVWAIVYLPSMLIGSTASISADVLDSTPGSSNRRTLRTNTNTMDEESNGFSPIPFVISMNYSATPWTFPHDVQSLFSAPSEGSAGYVLYWTSGFMTLQTFVQQFLLELHIQDASASMLAGPATFSNTTNALNAVSTYLNAYGPAIVPMPTPSREDNSFLDQWGYYLPFICALGALFPVSHLTALIVEDKPKGIRDLGRLMGMSQTGVFAGWYVFAFLLDVTVSLLASLFFKIGFFHQVSYSILFVLYFSFLQQNTALSLLLSSLFRNPRIASWCAALTVFVFVMPYYVFPPGMTDSARFGASIVPCVGFSNAMGMLVSYVTFAVEVNWTTVRQAGGYFTVQDCIAMMWTSFAGMMFLAWYLDQVLPSMSRGFREHPLFFLRPLVRWYRSGSSRQPHSSYTTGLGMPAAPGGMPLYATTTTTSRNETQAWTTMDEAKAMRKRISASPFEDDDHGLGKKERRRSMDPLSTISSPANDGLPSVHGAAGTSTNLLVETAPSAAAASSLFIEHYDEVIDPSDPDVPVVFKDVCVTYITGSLLGFLYTFFTGLFRQGDFRLALRKMSFALHRGEVSVLLGPNGSGKSTVMKLATSMQRPASGRIFIGGKEVGKKSGSWGGEDEDDEEEAMRARRASVGYCPQHNMIWEDLTVEEHFAFYARVKGVKAVREEVESLLAITGLTDSRARRAGHLSGGEKRRVCVGIALIGNPSVLFMDEPTAGLDVQCRHDVYEVLQRVRESRSILISTHLLDEADRLGDRLFILHNGELCGEGSSMFLKTQTNAGYKLTCVMKGKDGAREGRGVARRPNDDDMEEDEEEEAAVQRLIAFVQEEGAKNVHHHRPPPPLPGEDDDSHDDMRDAVVVQQAIPPGCPLLGLHRRGREVTFLFPLSLFSRTSNTREGGGGGRRLVRRLEEEKKRLGLCSVGVSLSGLDDVFQRTTMAQVGLAPPVGEVLEGMAYKAAPSSLSHLGGGGTGGCPFARGRRTHEAVVAEEARNEDGNRETRVGRGYPWTGAAAERQGKASQRAAEGEEGCCPSSSTSGVDVPLFGMCPMNDGQRRSTEEGEERVREGHAQASCSSLLMQEETGQAVKTEGFFHKQCAHRFARDFRAFFLKRLHSAKRDARLVFFQIALPMIFLAVALLVNLAQAPLQPGLTLDWDMYGDDASHPSTVWITTSSQTPNPFALTNATSWMESTPLGPYYRPHVLMPSTASTSTDTTSSSTTTNTTSFNGLANDALLTLNAALLNTVYEHGDTGRYVALALANDLSESVPTGSSGPGMNFTYYTNAVYHNLSYPHAAPQAINALYQLAQRQLFGAGGEGGGATDSSSTTTSISSFLPPLPVARNVPMDLGPFEQELVDASKVVMVGMFVILPFVLIPANTIRYVVREKEVGARHLQWLTGASMAAYWMSAFAFDFLCYVGTVLLAYIVFLLFGRNEYYGPGMLGPSLCLFFFFGISSIPSSYVLSFFFTSPFKAQNTVLLLNFVFGFLWVTMESVIGASALNFVRWVTRFLRVLPSVSFGEGLYVVSGSNLARLMEPEYRIGSLFSLLHIEASSQSIFKGGVGTGLIYMGSVFCASIVALTLLETFRMCHLPCSFASWKKCLLGSGREQRNEEVERNAVHVMAGGDGRMEEEGAGDEWNTDRPRARLPCGTSSLGVAAPEWLGSASDEAIVLEHVSKYYGSHRGERTGSSQTRTAPGSVPAGAAVQDVSFGVHRGEVLALLGLNGAGKTTILRMLSGELQASSGEIWMNHTSIRSEASRPFIGYCPQFDALLDHLNAEEHLYLYARLRGLPEASIPLAVDQLIQEVGLSPHKFQTASALSGGNRRRLSLAIALIGNTISILLDEPTAGMDALARSQTCAAIQRLTSEKSVILTTHLLDEAEALAHRVAVLSHGQIARLGTIQELRSQFCHAQEEMHAIRIYFPSHTLVNTEVLEALEAYIVAPPPPPTTTIGASTSNATVKKETSVFSFSYSSSHAVQTTSQGDDPKAGVEEEEMEKAPRRCTVKRVLRSGVEMVLHGIEMEGICTIIAALSEGTVPGVPSIAYVSVSQPSLENVLLAS